MDKAKQAQYFQISWPEIKQIFKTHMKKIKFDKDLKVALANS